MVPRTKFLLRVEINSKRRLIYFFCKSFKFHRLCFLFAWFLHISSSVAFFFGWISFSCAVSRSGIYRWRGRRIEKRSNRRCDGVKSLSRRNLQFVGVVLGFSRKSNDHDGRSRVGARTNTHAGECRAKTSPYIRINVYIKLTCTKLQKRHSRISYSHASYCIRILKNLPYNAPVCAR